MSEVCRADATVAVATAQPVPPSVLCRNTCPVSAVTAVQPLTEVCNAAASSAASQELPVHPSVLCRTSYAVSTATGVQP